MITLTKALQVLTGKLDAYVYDTNKHDFSHSNRYVKLPINVKVTEKRCRKY